MIDRHSFHFCFNVCNVSIDVSNFFRNAERKALLLKTMLNLLMKWCNDSALSEWLMHFLGKVQSKFNQEYTKDSLAHSLFSLDVFIFSLVVVTGCATFIDDELSLKNRLSWLNKLPEALWLISKEPRWCDHMPRVRHLVFALL